MSSSIPTAAASRILGLAAMVSCSSTANIANRLQAGFGRQPTIAWRSWLPSDVTLFSDSEYLVNAMRKGWARRWKANGWKRRKNPDLWKHLLVLCDKHAVTFEWVKGHAGQPENELCDQLSMKALRQPDLPPDDDYVPSSPVQNSGAEPQTPEATTQHRPEKSKPIDGGPCPKCGTRLERRTPKSKPKESQSYYFEYYLYCPGCSRMFMVEEAKRNIDRPGLFE